MKGRLSLAVAASALLIGAPAAFAFHSGGVAECEGCHSMHNSKEGAAMFAAKPQFQSGPYLLQGSDASSACLNCHGAANDTAPSSYHIYDNDPGYGLNDGIVPANLTPGGDFAWLKKSFRWQVRNNTWEESQGERHGHNIIAADYGFVQDSKLATAPGGTYPASQLACSSCHDPHGKYRRDSAGAISTTGLPIANSGSYSTSNNPTATLAVGVYRILGGTGYKPKSVSDASLAFANQVPAAVAPSSYNRTEATTQTRVAYGAGMSEWCANCHGTIHTNSMQPGQSGQANLTHPASNTAKLTSDILANYNSYVKSGDLTGVVGTAYNSLVPFEMGTTDYAAMKAAVTTTSGADANSNVNCLSCHRAHASAFDAMTRYDAAGIEFMTIQDAGGVTQYGTPDRTGPYPTDPILAAGAKASKGLTVAEYTAAMQGRAATKFAPYQRSLCNKCHAKD